MKNTEEKKKRNDEKVVPLTKNRAKSILLVSCNVFLAIALVVAILIYTNVSKTQREQTRLNSFCNIVDSMKRFSQNTLSVEKDCVDNWASFINQNDLTAEEALDYIRTVNKQSNRIAHLVDMEGEKYAALTTYENTTSAWTHIYMEESVIHSDESYRFINRMEEIYSADKDSLYVLGKYRATEWQRTVISVGSRVELRRQDGTEGGYLLLRLIPTDELQQLWTFSTGFQGSEISLIADDGGYIVQSASLRSSTLPEFIRIYNFQNDYTQATALIRRLQTTDRGLLTYNNSKGQLCYFYYSALEIPGLDILGYIPVANLQAESPDLGLVFIVCGILSAILLLDGLAILSVNKRLRRSVAAEKKANSAKTMFLSSMSHDMRTPMNAVRGATELAKLHIKEPEIVKDCLEKVSRASEHLLTLISDILDVSKIESGKTSLHPAPLSLHEFTEELNALIRQLAREKDVEFSCVMQNIPHDCIVGDRMRLQQILVNLLNNAVKYTNPGGKIVFKVDEAAVPDHKDLVELCFVVADNGIGMSKEFQKRMYETFSRAIDGRVSSKEGSGLGLSIVKRITELMNGTIACESEPGKGTTFTVKLRLPYETEAPVLLPDGEKEPDLSETDFSGLKILVAEDNEINWEIVCGMLSEYGVSSDRAKNGQVCLDILSDKTSPHYNAIFMDVQMPVMNGREATRQIRASKDESIKNIPVVAMTADAFAEDTAACFAAGMDEHIAKPIDMKQIANCLKKIKNGTLRAVKEENK